VRFNLVNIDIVDDCNGYRDSAECHWREKQAHGEETRKRRVTEQVSSRKVAKVVRLRQEYCSLAVWCSKA